MRDLLLQCSGAAAIVVALFVPLILRDRVARFWGLGLVLSLVPIGAVGPENRLLGFVGLGSMALLAQLAQAVFADSLDAPRVWKGFAWIAIPLLLYFATSGAFMFGYAKPVPVAFGNLRNPRWGSLWVAAAGPLCNFIQALIWGVFGIALAVFNVDGTYYVTDDTCTHGPGSLSEGYIEGDVVECNFHNGQFNICTGAVVSPPCMIPVKTYPTTVENGKVVIEI